MPKLNNAKSTQLNGSSPTSLIRGGRDLVCLHSSILSNYNIDRSVSFVASIFQVCSCKQTFLKLKIHNLFCLKVHIVNNVKCRRNLEHAQDQLPSVGTGKQTAQRVDIICRPVFLDILMKFYAPLDQLWRDGVKFFPVIIRTKIYSVIKYILYFAL